MAPPTTHPCLHVLQLPQEGYEFEKGLVHLAERHMIAGEPYGF